jgi:hypothetical protein
MIGWRSHRRPVFLGLIETTRESWGLWTARALAWLFHANKDSVAAGLPAGQCLREVRAYSNYHLIQDNAR